MPTETKTAEPPVRPVVEVVQETALAPLPVRGALQPLLGALAFADDPEAVIQRFAKTWEALQRAAIAATFPTDWYVTRDGAGNEFANPLATVGERAYPFAGIDRIDPLPGQVDLTPELITLPGDKRGYRCRGIVRSQRMGIDGEEIEVTRGEGEDFTGRMVNAAGNVVTKRSEATGSYEPDLRKSARTALKKEAVVKTLGLRRVPLTRLDEVWTATGKGAERKSSMIVRGSGYGSSTERNAGGVATGDTKGDAKALGDEILRRTGGDAMAASEALQRITINKEGKYAKKSVREFTKPEQVQWAWERLAKDKEIGDHTQAAQQQAPAAEREPGQDGE